MSPREAAGKASAKQEGICCDFVSRIFSILLCGPSRMHWQASVVFDSVCQFYVPTLGEFCSQGFFGRQAGTIFHPLGFMSDLFPYVCIPSDVFFKMDSTASTFQQAVSSL